MTGLPTILYEIEFVSGAWTDVTAYVDPMTETTITRGRASQSDDGQPGTAALTLRNDDGRFTPDNPAGAYFPNVVPGKRIRITAASSVRFVGQISTLDPKVPDGSSSAPATVAVTAIDALGAAATMILPPFSTFAALAADNSPSGRLLGYFAFNDPANTDCARFSDASGHISGFTPLLSGAGATYATGSTTVLESADGMTGLDVNVNAGGALTFRSASSSIIPTTGLSIAFWMRIDAGTLANSHMTVKTTSSGGSAIQLSISGGFIDAQLFDSGSTFLSGSATIPDDGALHHYCLTWDTAGSHNGFAYLDGVQILSGGWSPLFGPAGISKIDVTLENLTTPTIFHLQGLGYWGRPLTVAEVRALNASGRYAATGTSGDQLAALATLLGFSAYDRPSSGTFTPAAGLGRSAGPHPTAGKSVADAMRTVMRGESRILYADQSAICARLTSVNPATVALTLDAESDLQGSPVWTRSNQSRAYAVTVKSLAAGETTAFDAGAPAQTSTSVDTALGSATDLQAAASRVISESRDARLRLTRVVLDLVTSPVTAASVFALILGDRIRVSNLPSSVIGWTYQDGYLLGYSERIGLDHYFVEMDLAPADAPSAATSNDATRDRAMSGGLMTLTSGITSSGTSVSVTMTPVNLCSNPGFETVTTGWTFPGGTLTRDLVTFRSGVASLKCVAVSAGISIYAFTATIGVTYTASAWVYVPAGNPTVTAAIPGIGFGTSTGATVNSWVQVSVTGVATSTAMQFQLWGGSTAGNTYYVDDAQIYTPTPTLSTSAGSYPLDLDINGERVTIASAPGSSSSPQTVTVTRGVAPSVARAHLAGESVEVWQGARAAY